MLNGDRYVGTVLSLNTNTLLLHSEVLGDVTLPRGKVALITLRPAAVTNRASSPVAVNSAPRQLPTARTNAAPEQLPAGFGLLAANTNLVAKVTGPLLDGAGPEAKAKFNELFGGLMSGTVSVDDIRAQARSAVEQVKALKKESGDDTGMLDGYLTILEKFLGETPAGATTNAAASKKQL
jgi:hypothetical protein